MALAAMRRGDPSHDLTSGSRRWLQERHRRYATRVKLRLSSSSVATRTELISRFAPRFFGTKGSFDSSLRSSLRMTPGKHFRKRIPHISQKMGYVGHLSRRFLRLERQRRLTVEGAVMPRGEFHHDWLDQFGEVHKRHADQFQVGTGIERNLVVAGQRLIDI